MLPTMMTKCAVAVALAALALAAAGCATDEERAEALPWFVGEYVDPSYPGGAVRLAVLPDGSFTLTQRGHWCDGEEDEVRREIANGSWTSLGDGVELQGDAWSAVLVSDEIAVALPGRSDTLPGLRCEESTGPALMDSVRLLRYREFADFVRPPEGSGSSTGGL